MQSCVSKYLKRQQEKEDEEEEGGLEREERREKETPEVMESAQAVLVSLVSRMIKSETEDFELDKSSDFSPGSSVGQKNRQLARLVMGVQEVRWCGCCTGSLYTHTQCRQPLVYWS